MINKYKQAYEQAEPFTGEYERLEAGGYICRILKVTQEEKHYGHLLRIAFDVVEGENGGFYKRQFDRKKETNPDAKWPGMYYQTISEKHISYFKGFIESIEKSNAGYKWDWSPGTLKGKLFGGVFGEEEYQGNDGSVKTSVKCMWIRSVDDVKKGNFTIPEKKKLQTSEQDWVTIAESNLDEQLPF